MGIGEGGKAEAHERSGAGSRQGFWREETDGRTDGTRARVGGDGLSMSNVVPREMGANGELTIVLHPRVNISLTSYSASGQGDGSNVLNGWSKVVDVYDMNIGDMTTFVLHHGRAGSFLFLGFIVAESDE